MKIQTITGSSIQAALAEARRLLGDDVVLLESVPPAGSEPARITVMIDTSAAQQASEPAPETRRAVGESVPLIPTGYGYGAIKRQGGRGIAAEESARLLESFSTAGDGSVQGLPASAILHDGPHRTDDRVRAQAVGRPVYRRHVSDDLPRAHDLSRGELRGCARGPFRTIECRLRKRMACAAERTGAALHRAAVLRANDSFAAATDSPGRSGPLVWIVTRRCGGFGAYAPGGRSSQCST